MKISQKTADACTGMRHNPDLKCLEDPDGVNWWLGGIDGEWHLVNWQGCPVTADMAAILIPAETTVTAEGRIRTARGSADLVYGHRAPELKDR